MSKDKKLQKGLDMLLGSATSRAQEVKEAETDLLETVKDEELKEQLRQRQLDGRGRPKRGRPKEKSTEGYTTVCVKANKEKWEKLKYISLQETLQIKEVLEIALDKVIAEYEEQKGKIVLHSGDSNVFNK